MPPKPVDKQSEVKKFNFNKLIEEIQSSFKKDKARLINKIGLGSSLKSLTKEDFILMPDWWTIPTKTYGIPFGKVTLIAGQNDSGKTSIAIETVKAAQKQGVGVCFVESEHKSTVKDFIAWGVDPEAMILIQTRIAEEAFEALLTSIDKFREIYSDAPLLVVIDSLGNSLSMRDSELDFVNQSQQPGGKGKVNRLGLNSLVARMEQDFKMAVLLISYTYDNMGSPGKTNAGGQALNFFSSLTYQTSRKGWVEKTVEGVKQRIGADVVFKLYKNHINKDNPGMKEIVFRITKDGMSYLEGKNDD